MLLLFATIVILILGLLLIYWVVEWYLNSKVHIIFPIILIPTIGIFILGIIYSIYK